MKKVLCQKWEESERDWGVRPDGYSLHPSEGARQVFVAAYWAPLPDTPPDTYSRPSGTPYWCGVDEETAPTKTTAGVRFFDNNYPGDEGPDGWKHRGES